MSKPRLPVHRVTLRQLAIKAQLIDPEEMQSSFKWSVNTYLDLLEQRWEDIREYDVEKVEDLISQLAENEEEEMLEEDSVEEDSVEESGTRTASPLPSSTRRRPSRKRSRNKGTLPNSDLVSEISTLSEKIEFIGKRGDEVDKLLNTIATQLEEISSHLVYRYNMEYAEGDGDLITSLDQCDWGAAFDTSY